MVRYDNPVKARLLAGEQVAAVWLKMAHPAVAEIAAQAKPEAIVFDAQHGTWDRASLEQGIGQLDPTGPVPFVRVRENSAPAILDALDSGALGVIVPMVSTAEEAAAAVASAKYPPEGNRSVGGLRPLTDIMRYVGSINDQVLVAVMIETAEGLENAAAIAATPGVDMIFIGPGDLSLALGTWPDDGPKFEAAVQKILDAALDAGRVPGIFTGNAQAARSRFDQGFRLAIAAADLTVLPAAIRAQLIQLES